MIQGHNEAAVFFAATTFSSRRVGVIETKNSRVIAIMQSQRILYAMRPEGILLDLVHLDLDPIFLNLVVLAVKIEQCK